MRMGIEEPFDDVTVTANPRVTLARRRSDGRRVVLKAGSPPALAEELRQLQRHRHPELVALEGVDTTMGAARLVLTHAPGVDALSWVRGGDGVSRAATVIARLLRPLAFLHRRGVVHRDLKPEHVIVTGDRIAMGDRIATGDGAGPQLTLIDLGLVRRFPAPEIVGTRGFIAPEIAAGGPATPASDGYALGALFFALLTGAPPELGAPVVLPAALPALLREVIGDLLASESTRRPELSRVAAMLADVLGQPVPLALEPPIDLDRFLPLVLSHRHQQRLEGLAAELGAGARERSLVRLAGPALPASLAALRDIVAVAGELQPFWVEDTSALEGWLGLAAAVGSPGSSGSPRSPDTTERRVARVLEALMERPGTVLLFGRLDPTSHALLEQLARLVLGGALEDVDLAVVWLDDGRAGPLLRQASQDVVLPPLDAEEVGELVSAALHASERLDVGWVDAVAAGSRGEPRRLLAALRAQLAVAPTSARLCTAAAEALGLRSTVEALAPLSRELLATVALAPRRVPVALLSRVAPRAMEALGALSGSELLLLDGGAVALAPGDELRELAQAGLSAAAQRDVHRAYAAAWADSGGPAALRGHHLLRAGDLLAGCTALVSAPDADPADLEWAVAEAERQPQHGGLGRSLWGELLVRVARQRRVAGDLEAALAAAERIEDGELAARLAAELLLDAGDAARALERLAALDLRDDAEGALLSARAKILLGEFGGATADARRGLSQARGVLQLRLANTLGLGQLYAGDVAAARDSLATALELGRERARREGVGRERAGAEAGEAVARLLNSLGITYQRLQRLDEAQRCYAEGLDRFRALGDLRLAATCALNLGTVAHERGAWGEALAAYRKASELDHRAGSGSTLGATGAWALANEGNLLCALGAFDAAAVVLQRAEARARELGGGTLLGHVLLYRGDRARLLADPSAAQTCLSAARECFGAEDAPGQDEAALLAGELALAGGAVDEAAHILRGLRGAVAHWRGGWLEARLDAAAGNDRRAAEAAERALALAPLGAGRLLLCGLAAALRAALGEDERVTAHAERYREALAELRTAIPPQHRASFDAHPEIVLARQRLAQSGAAAPGPPAAGIRRLLEINRELNQRLPLETLLERILDGAIELSGAERGFILLASEHGRRGKLRLAAARTVEGERLRHGLAKLSQSIAEQAIREGRTLVVADAGSDERYRARLSVSGLKLRAVLCVPLSASSELRGALYLDNRYGSDVFRPSVVALAEAFAAQAGIALENGRLLEEATKRGEELAQAKAELEQLNERLQAELARQSATLSEIRVRLDHQEEDLVRRFNAAQIVGRSKPLRQLFAQLERIARADLPVVIHGESGTGKELVARALHRASARAEQPFVAVNCGALPASLLESELFGYARGAFTGAVRDRPGIFEVAGAGTLFLDEVGDMDAEMQVKLLRILQEGTFRRLGEERERQSHCRVISASHRRLETLVAQGRFREDLFYRLHVLRLDVPALRERRDDIPLLIDHLLARQAAQRGGREVELSKAALRALVDHDWPGNVRELENELARAALLCERRIELSDLSPAIAARFRGEEASTPPVSDLKSALAAHERMLIEAALERADGNVTRAAQALGLHRVALHRKLRSSGVRERKTR